MYIAHIAIWTKDLEKMKEFYVKYFGMNCGEKYHNPQKEFTSYFLSFEMGAQLELMTIKDLIPQERNLYPVCGITHFAIQLDSRNSVDQYTEMFRADGYPIYSEPRFTGDGYYESGILDPDGNKIELVGK